MSVIVTRNLPQGLARLNPIYKTGLALLGSSAVDVARNSPIATTGSVTKTATPQGNAYQFNSNSNYFTASVTGPALLLGSFTLLYNFRQSGVVQNGGSILNIPATSGNSNALWVYTLSSNVLRCDIFDSGGTNYTVDSAAILSVGTTYSAALVVDVVAKTLQWWINGIPSGSSTSIASWPGRNGESNSYVIAGPVRNFAPNHDVALLAVVPSVLSSDVLANPYQIFASDDDPLWVASAAGSVSGALGWLEANDTTSISGSVTTVGTAAWTEASDTTSITASVSNAASLAWAEANDATAINAAVIGIASLAWTEANDTTAISGSVSTGGAVLNWTEQSDVSAIVAKITNAGASNWTETSDVTAITANVPLATTGALNWAEQNDVCAIIASAVTNGWLGWTEQSDITAIAATYAQLVTALLAWTEANDIGPSPANLVVTSTAVMSNAPINSFSVISSAPLNQIASFL